VITAGVLTPEHVEAGEARPVRASTLERAHEVAERAFAEREQAEDEGGAGGSGTESGGDPKP
jgi:hypothetical protein